MKKEILFDSTSASDKKTVHQRKALIKEKGKANSSKSSGTRTVSESAKATSGCRTGSTQYPVAAVPANGYKDGVYGMIGTDSVVRSVYR